MALSILLVTVNNPWQAGAAEDEGGGRLAGFLLVDA